MSNEIDWLDKAAEAGTHIAWIGPLIAGALLVVKKAYNFFQGINRLADNQALMAEQLQRQHEKLEKMMEGDDVDLRVAPVIREVAIVRDQISKIHDYLLNRPRNERVEDAEKD